jgi:hypothetical protein
VCNQPGCYSSITVLNGEIKKVKGQKMSTNDLSLSHEKHGPYKAEEIIGMNFKKVLKNRIEKEGSKSATEIYREEHSK